MLGFGTWVDVEGGADPSTMEGIVENAIGAGYRRFDTGHDYKTEEYVLRAINKKLSRNEVHITSKNRAPPTADQVREMLAATNNSHYDNFLLHTPPKTANKEEAEKQLLEAWETVNSYQRKDLAKQIGVSNFYQAHLNMLLALCEKHQLAPPTSNQLEIHPLCQERDYVGYLQERKISVIAHTPLGGIASSMIFENEPIAEVAKSLGCTASQAILVTTMFRGIEVIPRGTSLEHMQQNFSSKDFVSKVTADHLSTLANADLCTNMVEIALEAREFNDQLQ